MCSKESLSSKVIIDDSSVVEFLNIVNSKDALNKETINKLLDTTGYERLIRLGGPNIGIDSKDKWVKLFNEALNSKENEINENTIIMYLREIYLSQFIGGIVTVMLLKFLMTS